MLWQHHATLGIDEMSQKCMKKSIWNDARYLTMKKYYIVLSSFTMLFFNRGLIDTLTKGNTSSVHTDTKFLKDLLL